jgi:hypothetical protein
MHNHHVGNLKGQKWGGYQQIKALVGVGVSHTSNIKTSTITLAMSKTFMPKHLFNEHGNMLVELLKDKKLHHVMDKFIALCYPNNCTFQTSFG